MRRKILWITAALALIAIPAVIGLVALRGDDSTSSARRAGALVTPGAAVYQLQLVQALPGTTEVKNAIELDSFSWGATNPTTIGSATGGAGAGKIQFNELKITKKVDGASPAVFKNMAAGAHFKTATLTVRKAAGEKPYMTFTMDTVFVTKMSYGGTSPATLTEEVTVVFGKVVIDSTDPAMPGRAGWDQVTNTSFMLP